MDEKEGKVVFVRRSAKGKHLYGFAPEGGIQTGESIVMPLEYLRKVVKGELEYCICSVLPPKEK